MSHFQNLDHAELKTLLLQSNLNIGMGTAALEGAKLGIPTLIVDAAKQMFPSEYKYRWIFESQDLSLGRMLNFKKNIELEGRMNIEDVFYELKSSYLKISQNSYLHTFNNYEIGKVASTILNYRSRAKLSICSFENLLIVKVYRVFRYLGIK